MFAGYFMKLSDYVFLAFQFAWRAGISMAINTDNIEISHIEELGANKHWISSQETGVCIPGESESWC